MNDVLVIILSLIWIPTVVGLFRSWQRYWRVRNTRGAWLVQLPAIIASIATLPVTYISLASANRWLGNPPFEGSAFFGLMAAFLIALIVPVIEIRFEMWSRGAVPDPTPPVPGGTNGN